MDAEIDLTCENCGENDFYHEMGLYFCLACHTQTQEVKEFAAEIETNEPLLEDKTKIKSAKVKDGEISKLTSWECYNYLIKGLCDELVKLEAGNILKSVVKRLWFRYLLKLEVINVNRPKLQAVNSKLDAEIVYGKKRRRKKKSRTPSTRMDLSEDEISMMDEKSLRRERSKRQKKLAEAHYDYSILSQGDLNASLANETLGNLKTSSKSSSETSIPVAYNTYAEEELKKRVSQHHLLEHSEDFENVMKCHPNSYHAASNSYRCSPYVLSVNKVYSLLYLGLLITKSKIQLSDMLRFIREGHLSYNNFKHFFPEDLNYNYLTRVPLKNRCMTSLNIRKTACQLAHFLEVDKFLPVQNLVQIVKKFCKELCLPDIFEKRTMQLISFSLPQLVLKESSSAIPNYEGRVLSLILFQLKLFYGLDGKTEKELSRYADIVNATEKFDKMFNFCKWLQFIRYREKLIKDFHFPTSFYFNNNSINSYLKFVLQKCPEYDQIDPSRPQQRRRDDCLNLLSKARMALTKTNIDEPIIFSPSLTPFKEYLEILLAKEQCGEVQRNILTKRFENHSIEYLINPLKYLSLINKQTIEIRHRGANCNVKMYRLTNLKYLREKELINSHNLKVLSIKNNLDDDTHIENDNLQEVDINSYYEDFDETHEDSFTLNKSLREARSEDISIDLQLNNNETYGIHHNPHECYWINTNYNLPQLFIKDFNEHYSSYSYTFRKVFEEILRISEQNKQELLYEFSQTELYLLYNVKYNDDENLNLENVYHDKAMKVLIKKSTLNW